MKTLESALTAFWKAVGEGIKGLKPVDELTYDGMTAVVINADPSRFPFASKVKARSTRSKLPRPAWPIIWQRLAGARAIRRPR